MTGKTRVICFANNKGGSGKSTTCSNVGYGLTQLGRKVLLIDGDMQLNLSLSLFDEDTVLGFAQGEKNLYEGIRRQDDLKDYIVHTEYENLDLIPSSTLMSSIEYELFTKWQREYILKKGLKSILDPGAYDYILIDTPPVGSLVDAAVIARYCDGAVFVVEQGAVSYKMAQRAVRQLQKSGCRILGAVLNKVEPGRDKYYRRYGEYYRKAATENRS